MLYLGIAGAHCLLLPSSKAACGSSELVGSRPPSQALMVCAKHDRFIMFNIDSAYSFLAVSIHCAHRTTSRNAISIHVNNRLKKSTKVFDAHFICFQDMSHDRRAPCKLFILPTKQGLSTIQAFSSEFKGVPRGVLLQNPRVLARVTLVLEYLHTMRPLWRHRGPEGSPLTSSKKSAHLTRCGLLQTQYS